ncbi:FAD-binding domain-containing protein [Apiospora marii]|uniref:FAD-binding domain-containing protein n=1 Tax=Apiospora marii TaxID=335849 RepID=A0ABR1SH66_9PEZI
MGFRNRLITATTAVLWFASSASSQTLTVDGTVIEANSSTLAPALFEVDPDSLASPAELFASETLQLTDDVIANLTSLNLSNITAFQFDSRSDERGPLGKCKTYPGDLFWPSDSLWNVFDLLLGGALIKTIPYASPCYTSFGDYNAKECQSITDNWVFGSLYHTHDPTSINAVLFQGQTCMPPTMMPGTPTCTVGGYPAYVVNATNVAQIQLAVNLARNLNLRLVVKNTGHDFGAKSTGMGALSIWTHHLKDIRFIESYQQDDYTGPAFKVGAGTQAYEMYEAAHAQGHTAVGGEGRTVGVMGGYTLGGGHSPLSSLYGMAADQVLSMEVVTADGRFLTANASSHPDLFWALCGGGGSTYGVVTSVTVKALPRIPVVTTMTYTLATGANVTTDQFWAAWRAFFDGFVEYTDAGCYEYFRIQNLGDGQFTSDVGPWFAPGLSQSQLQKLTAPLFARFEALGLEVEPVYKEYGNYYDAWAASFPTEPRAGCSRANWEDPGKLNATFDAIRSIVEDGGYLIGFNIAANPTETGYPDNAVNPAWRKTVMHAIVASLWDAASLPEAEVKKASDVLTFDWMPRLRGVSPGAGAYMAEADYIEPDFAQAFFGDKYPRLYELKRKWDPRGLFYAHNAVGSEDWAMEEMILGNLPSQNSRLCRK